jgi:hypothetical protein
MDRNTQEIAETLACAAGIYIPDDKYDKSMESRTLDMLINDKTLDKDMFPDFSKRTA